MSRCKECIHYIVCAKEGRLVQIDEHTWDNYNQLDDVERFCVNHLAADVVPRAEVAEELTNMALLKIQIMISAIKAQEENGIITEFNGGAKTALEIVFQDIAELKKKYTEVGK